LAWYLQALIQVQTEAEDFKSTVLSEDLVTLFTHMASPGFGVLGNVGLVSRLAWIQQGLVLSNCQYWQ